MDGGGDNFGCSHYKRGCKIRASCCNEIFGCRHCHNEVKNSVDIDASERHEIPRLEVTQVICSLCHMEQKVQQICARCGVCMGKYFCPTCKFFDDDVHKKQFHCNGCGICRTGGQENFFHCNKCGCCYAKQLLGSHRCIEKAMHHNCPVCFEYIFDSVKDISVLQCGHTIHTQCLKEMQQHYQFSCPICLKSICDMSKWWEHLDQEVAATPMPSVYQNKVITILCNDCGAFSEVQFNVIACKCINCNSYNTKQAR